MKKVKVMCTFFVEIELDEEEYARRHFIIEENGCPGTGKVGAALTQLLDWGDERGFCWACKAGGSNHIVFDEYESCRHVEMASCLK